MITGQKFVHFKSLGDSIYNSIKGPFEAGVTAAINAINLLIKGANKVSGLIGIKIPLLAVPSFSGGEMPALAAGADSYGGMALVGEEGPEVVTMPPKSSVAPAKTTSPAVETVRALTAGGAGSAAVSAAAGGGGLTGQLT